MRFSLFFSIVILCLSKPALADAVPTLVDVAPFEEIVANSCDDPTPVVWIGELVESYDTIAVVGTILCAKMKIVDLIYGEIEEFSNYQNCDDPDQILADSIIWIQSHAFALEGDRFLVYSRELALGFHSSVHSMEEAGLDIVPVNFYDGSNQESMTIEELRTDLNGLCSEFSGVGRNEFYTFSAFPNPANQYIQVNANLDFQADDFFVFYSMDGRKVKTIAALEGGSTISVDDLLSGTYLLSIERNGQVIGAEKVLVSR